MVRPLVSIVIDNRDYARFLPRAIESALEQRGADVEVVVVDDGSTDGSRELIAGYGDAVTALLKPHGGQASALNAGFAACRGDLVLFLDSDDALLPDAAVVAAAAWRPGVAKVQFPLLRVDAEGRPAGLRVPGGRLPQGDVRPLIRASGHYPSPPMSGNLFPRVVLERLLPMPEPEWRASADAYLTLLAPFLGEVVSIHRPLGYYRIHGGNLWMADCVSAGRLRAFLECDERRETALRAFAPAAGPNGAAPPDWLMRNPEHLQARIASLKLDPPGHPYPHDRVGVLAARGAAAALRDRSSRPLRRGLGAAWFLAVAGLPRRAAAPLIAQGYSALRRPALLQRLLGHVQPSAVP